MRGIRREAFARLRSLEKGCIGRSLRYHFYALLHFQKEFVCAPTAAFAVVYERSLSSSSCSSLQALKFKLRIFDSKINVALAVVTELVRGAYRLVQAGLRSASLYPSLRMKRARVFLSLQAAATKQL